MSLMQAGCCVNAVGLRCLATAGLWLKGKLLSQQDPARFSVSLYFILIYPYIYLHIT